MRLRFVGVALGALVIGALGACGFGIDVDGLFGSAGPGAGDGSSTTLEAGIPTLKVLQLAAGDGFTCGLRVDGSVMCWGTNDVGNLGNGLPLPSSVPVLVQDVNDAVDLAVGSSHACAVRKSGAVSCWGYNASRQLGDGTTDSSKTPRSVVALTDAKSIAAGSSFNCAIKADATVVCWGDNDNGQLGDGTTTARSQPAPVPGLADVTALGTAGDTACALVKSGDVLCWGKNDWGQAGVAPPAKTPSPTKVPNLSNVVALTSSGVSNHLCATLGTGEIKCWGYGGSGELGNAKPAEPNPNPTSVIGVNDAVGADTGSAFTCAWRKSGTVVCFGDDGWRKLGLGDTNPPDNISSPLPIDGLTGVTAVATGADHACALYSDGNKIMCWGTNVDGTLGRGTRLFSEVPVKAAFTAPMAKISAGHGWGLAIDGNGALYGWGDNGYRELAQDTFNATATPTPIPGVSGVTAAAGGNIHTCAVTGGGQVQCWGVAEYGALGFGQTPWIKPTPVVFAAPTAAIDVGGGYNFTCALLADGTIACSGSSHLGNPVGSSASPVLVLSGAVPPTPDAGTDDGGDAGDAGDDGGDGGDGGTADAGPPPPPPPPPNFTGATKISVGGGHSCVTYGGGQLACWGNNDYGQRGVSGIPGSPPNDVALPSPPLAFVAGGGHTCAVIQDGSVRCWGANDHGQVSGSSSNGPSLRTPDLGGKQAKALAAGDEHTCALLTDGTVSCWGAGTYGELGNGVRSDAPTPQVVKNLTNVTALAADEHFTCALEGDGSVWCWGSNTIGQLGDGTVMTTGVPASVVGY